MQIRKYKNGNFAVKREPDCDTPLDDPDFGKGLNLLFDLVNSHELDFQIAGDEGCAGNYAMYYPLYNAYTGLLYLPTDYDCNDYVAGKWVHLFGCPLSSTDIESLLEDDVISVEAVSCYEVWQLNCLNYGDGWITKDKNKIGEIIFLAREKLKPDILRTLNDQLNIQVDSRRVLLVEENGTLEIRAKKQGLPLFTLATKKYK